MEPGIDHDIENEEHFWSRLTQTVSAECSTHNDIDDALRLYLTLTTSFPAYIQSSHDVRRCACELYYSKLFGEHANYIRHQFVHCLLQEDDTEILHIITTLLLMDARDYEETYALLNEEGVFPWLVEMIAALKEGGQEDLHRQLMELLYEMARVQKITNDDLSSVDDDFTCTLFDIIEQVSGDVEDPYHYPVIRVLLVLNEQFMVAAHDPTIIEHKTISLTNKVMKVLSAYGSRYKTFGENIILLLNREDETSLQLLTLKLLYLLFTTPPTYEYFYTNDLHVLVDILIRNLLDLPEEASALRHTYLRVLYPLLEHTQLKDPPHYKQHEIRKLLAILAGGQASLETDSPLLNHFEEVDETTKRLVHRCQTVGWLASGEEEVEVEVEVEESLSPYSSHTPDTASLSPPSSPLKSVPPALPAPRKLRKRTLSKSATTKVQYDRPQLEAARQSSLSVAEMAGQKEKPGVITPSRNPSVRYSLRAAVMQKKEKPPPPKARRSGLTKPREDIATTPTSDLAQSQGSLIDDPTESPTEDSKQSEHETGATIEDARQSKKPPPPAPKARRWRGKKTRVDELLAVTKTQQLEMPRPEISLSTESKATADMHSPFSPPEEKTLSPFSSHADEAANKKSKRMSSVSAALEQAQAQALQDLEQTLEKVTIYEDEESGSGAAYYTPTTTQKAILAPPHHAPKRAVPGPTVAIEEKGSEPIKHGDVHIHHQTESPDEIYDESEDEWN